MKYFLKKLSVYIIILLGFISIYGLFCEYLYSGKDLYPGTGKRYWQLSLHKKTYDYAVLGSSRAFSSIDINLLDSITGQKGVNLGLNGSGFEENYITLKLFLLNKNTAKKLYFQVDPYSFMSEKSFSNSFHAYAYLPYWDKDQNIENILQKEVPYIKKLPFYFPYLTYFIYNNYYSPIQIARSFLKEDEFCRNPEYNCANGNKIFDKIYEKYDPKQKEGDHLKLVINPSDLFYYQKIIKLARKNNIALQFFTAPALDYFDKEFDEQLDEIDPEIYFRSTYNWKDHPELFANHSHLNYRGRKLFTLYFGKYLNDNRKIKM